MAPENYDSSNHEVVMKDLSLLAIRFIPAYLSQLQNFDLQKIFTEVNSGRWHFRQQPDVQRETYDCWSHLFNLLTGDVRHLSPNGQETKLDTAIGVDLCRFTMAIGHLVSLAGENSAHSQNIRLDFFAVGQLSAVFNSGFSSFIISLSVAPISFGALVFKVILI